MRGDRDRLLDIFEAIKRIERYANVEKPVFESDELVQTWMIHNIQIIGEAAASVSPELQARHPEIPWRAISSMRNALVHAYFRVDID